MELTFSSPFSYGISNYSKMFPSSDLLLYLDHPNSDKYLVGEDTYIWGYILPNDADIRSATGWVNGTANVFYTATGVPIVALATEIATAILPANVVFSLVDATTQMGKLAIFTTTTTEVMLDRARSALRDESINRLFYGVDGIWYDPQDLTTLFQDAAGTLPVYRPGTGLVDPPVGLTLDKGQGLELGPELVVNGDFSNGTAGWGAYSSTIAVINGALRITNTATISGYGKQTVSTVAGKTYRISSTFIAESGANADFRIGTVVDGSELFRDTTTNFGVVTAYIRATTTEAFISLFAFNSSGTTGSYVEFDNISVREIKGYHAYQTTTTARPTLSGRYNLLTATETLSTQSVTTAATKYTLSFSGTGTVTLSGTATGTYSAGTHTITCTAGTLTCTVAGSVTRADLRVKRDGSSLPAYQSVTSANTYNTAGFPLYLKRNKVDDDLIVQAPAITGAWAHGTIDGPVIGTVAIPAGEYHPFGTSLTYGLPNCTQWIAIDGTLSASEQAVFERYVYSKARQLIDVPQFGGVYSLREYFSGRTDIKSVDLSYWDTSNVVSLQSTFQSSGLTSLDLSTLDLSRCTQMHYFAWGSTYLDSVVIDNSFGGINTGTFTDAFYNTSLDQESVDAILIALANTMVSNGTIKFSNGAGVLTPSDAPSAAGEAAIDTLLARGWTVTVNGGY